MRKKIILLSIISIALLTLNSCEKESKTANVEVKVTQNGSNKSEVTVYMFNSDHGPDTNFFTPFFADKQSISGSNGVATFELQEVFDLEVIDTQTTLYFAVFSGEKVLGKSALTIKAGETKTIEIKL